jgi:hypothetical protein
MAGEERIDLFVILGKSSIKGSSYCHESSRSFLTVIIGIHDDFNIPVHRCCCRALLWFRGEIAHPLEPFTSSYRPRSYFSRLGQSSLPQFVLSGKALTTNNRRRHHHLVCLGLLNLMAPSAHPGRAESLSPVIPSVTAVITCLVSKFDPIKPAWHLTYP